MLSSYTKPPNDTKRSRTSTSTHPTPPVHPLSSFHTFLLDACPPEVFPRCTSFLPYHEQVDFSTISKGMNKNVRETQQKLAFVVTPQNNINDILVLAPVVQELVVCVRSTKQQEKVMKRWERERRQQEQLLLGKGMRGEEEESSVSSSSLIGDSSDDEEEEEKGVDVDRREHAQEAAFQRRLKRDDYDCVFPEENVGNMDSERYSYFPWIELAVFDKLKHLKKLTFIFEERFRVLVPDPVRCMLPGLIYLEMRLDRDVRLENPELPLRMIFPLLSTLTCPKLKELDLEGVRDVDMLRYQPFFFSFLMGQHLDKHIMDISPADIQEQKSPIENLRMHMHISTFNEFVRRMEGPPLPGEKTRDKLLYMHKPERLPLLPNLKKLTVKIHSHGVIDYDRLMEDWPKEGPEQVVSRSCRLFKLPFLQVSVAGNRNNKRHVRNEEYWRGVTNTHTHRETDATALDVSMARKQLALLFEAFGSGNTAVVPHAVVDLLSDPLRTVPVLSVLDGLETLLKECPLPGLEGILERVPIIADVVMAELEKEIHARDPSPTLGRISCLASIRRRSWLVGRKSFALVFATAMITRGLLPVVLRLLCEEGGKDEEGKSMAGPVMFLLRALPVDAFTQAMEREEEVGVGGGGAAAAAAARGGGGEPSGVAPLEGMTVPLLLRLVDTVTLKHARHDVRRMWNLNVLHQILSLYSFTTLALPVAVVRARERALSLCCLQCLGVGFLRAWGASSQGGRLQHPAVVLLMTLSEMDHSFLGRLREKILRGEVVPGPIITSTGTHTQTLANGGGGGGGTTAATAVGSPPIYTHKPGQTPTPSTAQLLARLIIGVSYFDPTLRVIRPQPGACTEEQTPMSTIMSTLLSHTHTHTHTPTTNTPIITPAKMELGLAIRKMLKAGGCVRSTLLSTIPEEELCALLLVLPIGDDDLLDFYTLLLSLYEEREKPLQHVLGAMLRCALSGDPQRDGRPEIVTRALMQLIRHLKADAFESLVAQLCLAVEDNPGRQLLLQVMLPFAELAAEKGEVVKVCGIVKALDRCVKGSHRVLFVGFLRLHASEVLCRIAVKVCDELEVSYKGCLRSDCLNLLMAVCDFSARKTLVREVVRTMYEHYPRGAPYVENRLTFYRRGGWNEPFEGGGGGMTSALDPHPYGSSNEEEENYGGDEEEEEEEEEQEEEQEQELMAPMVAAAAAYEEAAQAAEDAYMEVLEIDSSSGSDSDSEGEIDSDDDDDTWSGSGSGSESESESDSDLDSDTSEVPSSDSKECGGGGDASDDGDGGGGGGASADAGGNAGGEIVESDSSGDEGLAHARAQSQAQGQANSLPSSAVPSGTHTITHTHAQAQTTANNNDTLFDTSEDEDAEGQEGGGGEEEEDEGGSPHPHAHPHAYTPSGSGGSEEDDESDGFDSMLGSSDDDDEDDDDESSGDEYDDDLMGGGGGDGGGGDTEWYRQGEGGPDGVVIDCEAFDESELWL